MSRILVTSSRAWTSYPSILAGLLFYINQAEVESGHATVVHGDAPGGDQLATLAAAELGCPIELHRARDFVSPRARNQHMVDLGARFCLAWALDWASGTGMCARMARRAGITTVDFGVDTRPEVRSGYGLAGRVTAWTP